MFTSLVSGPFLTFGSDFAFTTLFDSSFAVMVSFPFLEFSYYVKMDSVPPDF